MLFLQKRQGLIILMLLLCLALARAPSFSVPYPDRKFDTVLMLLIGSPIKLGIAAPPSARLAVELPRSKSQSERSLKIQKSNESVLKLNE